MILSKNAGGFKFREYAGAAQLDSGSRRGRGFRRPREWQAMTQRGLREKFTWTSPLPHSVLYQHLSRFQSSRRV